MRYLLSFLPQNNLEDPARVRPTEDSTPRRGAHALIPDSPREPYDMRDVIRRVVDNGEFYEVHAL